TQLFLKSDQGGRGAVGNLIGGGFGLNTSTQPTGGTAAVVTTGLLGGDYVVAAVFGGFVGLAMLALLWTMILGQRSRARSLGRTVLSAWTTYVLFGVLVSVF